MTDDFAQALRLAEAILFASDQPVKEAVLAARLPSGVAAPAVLDALQRRYKGRGVQLVQVAGGWAFRTAPDLAPQLRAEHAVERKLSRAALETLAIVAYFQPVSRAEIEGIRGVAMSRGTLDQLLEAGWVQPGGRRETPGRPLTWVTTPAFLDHFGLMSVDALPGVEELAAAGLVDRGPSVVRMPGGPDDDVPGDGDSKGGTALPLFDGD